MDTITNKLTRALNLANDVFEDLPSWEALPDEQKLRFAYALMIAIRESKPREYKG